MAETSLAKIDAWLVKQNLNIYGDPEGFMYMGGSPLFNESTGESKSREEYLIEKFPNKPWDEEIDM